jgi:methylated-DNA-protein-cysteine methyltransferase-like protein
MAGASNSKSARAELLMLVRKIPLGRLASADALAANLDVPPPLVLTILSQLTDDERDLVPWHRVVARGGAIGRGPHRDQQFARLMREGVMVSPAGIVQDLPHVMTFTFDGPTVGNQGCADTLPQPAKPGGRSRGMKSHP